MAAIVEKLPQNADAIFTEAAWSILHADRDEPEYTNRFKKKCFLVSASDTTAAQEKYAIRNMEGAATFQESYVVTLYANSSNDQWQEVEFIPSDLNPATELNSEEDIPAGDFIFFPADNLISLPQQFVNGGVEVTLTSLPKQNPKSFPEPDAVIVPASMPSRMFTLRRELWSVPHPCMSTATAK